MKAFLKEKIKDKKVLILGFGKEGSATLSLLQSVGGYDSLHVADKNSVDIPGIPCICGDSYMDALEDYDLIFKSPGIAILDPNPNLLAKLTSQTACFLERYRDQIIGVTGTKGKSTTSSLIYHALKSAGKPAYL
ncbi:MAG: UDP-N-acetylmuramoyl-L-alanine--D-glutamate ligase, partial [Clostridia bacterium]|nr:UDP-N-acetylmuramoyl-L-alanine--D-glutamate ligase [Clostridia bacterium]